jgi:FADH2-dependent halogenase
MWSGKLASEVVRKSLESGHDDAREARKFESRVRAGMEFYWQMVEHYYTTPFMEVFLQRSNHAGLTQAVNAVLAGELEGGWKFRWRLRYFFFLVKLQGRLRLVPRISFDPDAAEIRRRRARLSYND